MKRHKIRTAEAEQVLRNDPVVVQYRDEDGEGRVLVPGQKKNIAKAHKTPRRMPRFKSEAEEAAWWHRNPGFLAGQFEKAAREGRIIRGLPGHGATRSVTIRLAVKDVETAQALAAKTGLPYQTYIKTVLHQALESARKVS